MRPDRLQSLRDAQRVAAKTFLSFPVAIVALGYVAWLLSADVDEVHRLEITVAGVGYAVLSAMGGWLVPKIMIRRSLARVAPTTRQESVGASSTSAGSATPGPAGTLQTIMFLGLAVAESGGLLGFALIFLGSPWWAYLITGAFSLVGMFGAYPRLSVWEKTAEEYETRLAGFTNPVM